jgi:release factor glutamine methyltransferase
MNNTLLLTPADLTIAAQLSWAASVIQAAAPSNDTYKLDAKILLSHCLNCDTTYLHTWPEKSVNHQQALQFSDLVKRRCLGHPVAHLVGYRDFWTLRLQVSNSTLIPRPETELLVESALTLDLPLHAKVLDLGTGTGAIALALASEKSTWQVLGIDKSHDAVNLAKQNAKNNQLENVQFEQSDWFTNVARQRFDLIVTNPPYVEQTSPYLTLGDVRFEPLSALISGIDGLQAIRFIIDRARDYLSASAWLVIEHGFEQGHEIRNIFESKAYVDICTIEDFNGLPRVTMAKFSGNHL